MTSFIIVQLMGIAFSIAGLALLKYDPLNLYGGEAKGILHDLRNFPWRG